MTRRGLAALIAGLVLGSCEPAFATTWTVTNDATLSAANAGAVAGDVVRLAAGTYTQKIAPAHTGTSGSPIMYLGLQYDPTAVTVAGIEFRPSSNTAGNYISAKWVKCSGDAGSDNPLTGGSYPFRGGAHDTLLKITATNSKLLFNTTYMVVDSCSFAGAEKQLTVYIPANGTFKDYDVHPDAQYQHPKYNLVKNSTFTWTSSASLQGASSGWQFVKLIRAEHNTFYNNTFNLTLSGGDGYYFALECYFSKYNLFQNNVWNYSASGRGTGTPGCWAFRDSSSFNRLLGNALTCSGTSTTRLGLSNDGSYPDSSVRQNYYGFNTMKWNTTALGGKESGIFYQGHASYDTLEFNVVSTQNVPAFGLNYDLNKYAQGLVIRHNTFMTTGSIAVQMASGGSATKTNRFASNIFYTAGANSSGSPTLWVANNTSKLDSAGVFFSLGGSAANAIAIGGDAKSGAPGTNAAPASSGDYGLAGKSVWGSPRLVDSTFATFDAHLLSGSYADNASGPTHIDGYAGAYAPGAATYWTITASAGSNGSISPSGSVSVVQGASQTFTITPNANYAVDSLKVDGAYVGALTTYTFTNVQAAHTIAATFKASVTNYTITASASNGVSISPNGAVTVASGGSQAFTITPTTGYHIVGISVDGSSVGASSPYTFTNVTANHTIVATGGINTYTITASAGANGSISPSGVTTLNYGDSQAYTMTPNSGYHVSAVTVDGSGAGTGTTYPFTNVTANHTIAVTFAADAATYTVTASVTGFGTITPGGATVWAAGTSPTYTIVPLDGYQTDDVLVDGVSVGTPTIYTFTSIGANHTISASFSVALVSYTITASAANGATITPLGSTLAGSGTNKTYQIQVPQGTSPAVYVDGVYAGQLTSYTFSSVAADHTIFATAVSVGGSAPSDGCACYRVQ